MDFRMTERLKNALVELDLDVPNNVYDQLKNKKNWIQITYRVNKFKTKIGIDDLYEIFDYDHHFISAVGLFESLKMRDDSIAVVLGQKQQGKSQFLFFMFKLLQELDEIVLFLDRNILPILQGLLCYEDIYQFWNSSGLSDECKIFLSTFQA
jgi:hypothetical protein